MSLGVNKLGLGLAKKNSGFLVLNVTVHCEGGKVLRLFSVDQAVMTEVMQEKTRKGKETVHYLGLLCVLYLYV